MKTILTQKSCLLTIRLTGFALLVASSPLQAIPPFSDYYTEDEPGLTRFVAGAFLPAVNGNGFALFGNSMVEGESGQTSVVPSLARFDEEGEQLWSVFMDPGFGPSSLELSPDFGDPDKVFAAFFEATGFARLSLINGDDLAADFAVRVPLSIDRSKATLNYYPNKLSALVQNRGSSIQVLVLDALGQRVFEKTYASPEFVTKDIPGFMSQTAKLSQISDRSGFFLSVHVSALNFSNPPQFFSDNTFFLLCLNNDGTLRWSKSFDLISQGTLTDISDPGPGNSYIYRLTDTGFDSMTGTAHTKSQLIKFASDGDLDFAETIDDVRLVSQLPSQDQGSLYLSGGKSVGDSLTASDFVVLKINAASGAIEAQAGLDQGENDSGSVGGQVGTSIYGAMISSDGFDIANSVMTLFRLDTNLENPVTVISPNVASFGQLVAKGPDELLFSFFDPSTFSIGAFALDNDFDLLAAGCELLSPATPNAFDPGLTAGNLSLEVATPSITLADQTSQLTATTMPVTPLQLSVARCGTGPTLLVLTIFKTVENNIRIEFPTQPDKTYEIFFSTDPTQDFTSKGTVSGTGNMGSFEEPPLAGGTGFYYVREN